MTDPIAQEKEENKDNAKTLKTRVTCKNCPSYYDPCLQLGAGKNPAHWIVVGRAPSGFSVGANKPFYGHDGRLFKKLVDRVIKSSPTLESNPQLHTLHALQIYYTYVVLSGMGKINKDHIKACTPNLLRELGCILGIKGREPVIIALGADILRAINIKVGKIDDVIGRFLLTTLQTPAGPRTFHVLPLMSMADLNRRQGASGVIETLLDRAANLALYGDTTGQQSGSAVSVPPVVYTHPKTIEEVTALVDMILNYSGDATKGPNAWAIGLDTETNTLHMYKPEAKVLMLSVSWDTDKAATILLDHPLTPYDSKLAWEQVRRLLACPKPKVFHHLKFDFQGLELACGCQINNVVWDTMASEHWIDENKKGLYGLKKLTPMYIPLRTGYDDELQGRLHEQVGQQSEKEKKSGAKKKKREKDFSKIPLDTILTYAASDSDVERQIMRKQWSVCKNSGKIEDAKNVMAFLYLPASRTLGRMEYHGLKVDMSRLEELDKNVCKLRDEKLEILRRDYNPTVNYAASGQIAKLMTELQFTALPGREYGSTDKETLQRYATLYGAETKRGKFALEVLSFRSANDAKSKFISKVRGYVMPDDSCIHCNFHLTGTATGRLSSSNPNLQNLGKTVCRLVYKDQQKIEHVIVPGFNAKKLFIPKKAGNILCNIDIKAAELRVYTAYSHDQKMIDILRDGIDVHSLVAEQAYGIPYAEIKAKKETDPDISRKRLAAKRVVFGTFYGAGPYKIAQQIESTREEGQRLIDILYDMFPDLAAYVENTREEVRASGYVRTLFGRYRRFKMAKMGNEYFEAACREAINMKIQSTASDLLLSQLCEIDNNIADLDGKLILTVHDSILLELPEKNVDKIMPFMQHWITDRVAEKYKWLPLPFAFECEVGPSYGELKEIK